MSFKSLFKSFIALLPLMIFAAHAENVTKPLVEKKILDNGLTVLVYSTPMKQRVSIQLWYNVGSKDEKSGEKGLAHFLEHMTLKGTEKMSETDIRALVRKLGGYYNAETYYDYTRYYFEVPAYAWQHMLPVLADCMCNCTLKQDLINSELKAVIQELKMYHDDNHRMLSEKMRAALWPDHPYHDPVIGYKQDLWNLNRDGMVAFYKKHYIPNNAVLVVVGNVNTKEVFEQAEKEFGSIPANFDYKKEEHYINKDILKQKIVLYRDIQQPIVHLSFVLPGFAETDDGLLAIIKKILCEGKGTRLYTKLVDELNLVTNIWLDGLGLFEHDIGFIIFQPKDIKMVNKIVTIIQQELDSIAQYGFSEQELQQAVQAAQNTMNNLDNSSRAESIAMTYLAKNDENYLFNYLYNDIERLNNNVKKLFCEYLRPSLMHKGLVLPLKPEDKAYWLALQKRSDLEDARILQGKVRESEVEKPRYALTIDVEVPEIGKVPKPTIDYLSNGIKVLSYDVDVSSISVILKLKAHGDYDSEQLPGLYLILCEMLLEGTQQHPGEQWAKTVLAHSMGIRINANSILMNIPYASFEKGLELLQEILINATLSEQSLDAIKNRAIAVYQQITDNSQQQAYFLAHDAIVSYAPYNKNLHGTPESIAKITRQDIVDFYKRYISPDKAVIAVVGNLKNYNVKEILEKKLGSWAGPIVEDINYPVLPPVQPKEIIKNMDRDQVVLSFAGLSVGRLHPDFDALLLLDYILKAKLFEIREKTGACYLIQSDLLSNAVSDIDNYRKIYIKAIVSPDRASEVQSLIQQAIDNVADIITEEDLVAAKNTAIENIGQCYARIDAVAETFLMLDKYNLPADYYEHRKEHLKDVTLDKVKEVAKRMVRSDKLVTVKVGRV